METGSDMAFSTVLIVLSHSFPSFWKHQWQGVHTVTFQWLGGSYLTQCSPTLRLWLSVFEDSWWYYITSAHLGVGYFSRVCLHPDGAFRTVRIIFIRFCRERHFKIYSFTRTFQQQFEKNHVNGSSCQQVMIYMI